MTSAEETFDEGDNGDDAETNDWDSDLSDLLAALSKATAAAIARDISRDIGGEYDPSDLYDAFVAEAGVAGRKINAGMIRRLAKRIADALADQDQDADQASYDAILGIKQAAVNSVYDDMHEGGTEDIATARESQVALTTGVAGAAALGMTHKTWIVNSGKPRPLHASVDGESVALGELFSNGMLGPGDIANGGIDQVAGCTCTLEYSAEDAPDDDPTNAGEDALEAVNGPGHGKSFNADQPRDEHGRFAPGDGGDDDSSSGGNGSPVSAAVQAHIGSDAAIAAGMTAEERAGAGAILKMRGKSSAGMSDEEAAAAAAGQLSKAWNESSGLGLSRDVQDAVGATLASGKVLPDRFGSMGRTALPPEAQTFVNGYVRSTYANTQEYLKSQGISSMEVHRGLALEEADTAGLPTTRGESAKVDFPTRPLSSYTRSASIAKRFATEGVASSSTTYGYVESQTVAASDIFSVGGHGPGAASEQEVIVIAHPGDSTVTSVD